MADNKPTLNIFTAPTKDDIRVGYISTDRGFVGGVTICEANTYAKANPGTVFILRNRENIKYIGINEVNQLTPNDIDVIAYIPPYTQVYLDAVPPTLKKDLISNVKSITEKYDFQFHDLSTKWKNENIFSDHIHVASNPKSLIYSETLATLIIPTQRQDYTSSEISDELFSRKDLSETNLSFVDLSGKDLSDKDLSYTNFYIL